MIFSYKLLSLLITRYLPFRANNELLEYRRSYDDEVIRLKATKQKLELQVSSLKITVDQRTKECEELTRICDDLITKVGR